MRRSARSISASPRIEPPMPDATSDAMSDATPDARSSALHMRGVSAGYGETVVLEDIDLALAPGECISVIGRNGVGKTTLLSTVMGHTTLHAGEVLLGGHRLNGVPSFPPPPARTGFAPQGGGN